MMNSDDDIKTALDQIREWEIFDIDWARLRNMVALKLDELCALSVGIAPDYARLIRDLTTIDPDDRERQEFLAENEDYREQLAGYRNEAVEKWFYRVNVALNHVVAGTLPIVRATAPIVQPEAPINRHFCKGASKDAESIELKIADFVAWATSLPEPWEMPDELKRMGPHPDDKKHTGEHPDGGDKPLTQRAETTYLNIIGALLDLMLGKSPSGKPYSEFRSQEAIIDALLAHHKGKPGIAERTLAEKFAAAKRSLNAT